MGAKTVLAVAAHPDDIEFVMAGTLLQLADVGWELHYFNLANGCCGSKTLGREACASVRLAEAQAAAAAMSATFHPPICDDMEVFYTTPLLARVAAVVRQIQPAIILTHSPIDYMEDHQNAARLAVGAAFVRGVPNFQSSPPVLSYDAPVAIYHAQPHGNRDPLGDLVRPRFFVDVTSKRSFKRELLGMHASQASWLDDTQALGSCLDTMEDFNREVGKMSFMYELAEGWRRHAHLGFAHADFEPLEGALTSCGCIDLDIPL